MDTLAILFEIIKDAVAYTLDNMRTGLIHMLGGYTSEDDVGVFNKVEHLQVTREYSQSAFLDGRVEYNEARLKADLMSMLIPHIRQYVDFESTVDPATNKYITKAHLRVVNLKEDK